MGKIGGFTFFSSYHESLKDLETDDRRELLEAIVNYVFDDIEPELTGFKKTIWTLMLPNLTTSKNKSKNAQKETNKNQKKIKSKSKAKQNKNNDLLENKNKNKEENKKRKEIEKEEEDILSITNTKNIYEYLEKNFGRTIAPIEAEKLDNWIEEFNLEIVKHAIDSSTISGVKTFNYVEGILRNWKACGYKSLEEIKNHEDGHYNSRIRGKALASELFEYNWLDDEDHE